MKPTTLITLLFATPLSHAATTFNGDTTNTSIIDNAVNVTTAGNTLTGSAGALVLTNANGINNNSGIASTSDINTLNGTPLLATDTVIMTLGVSSYTGDIRSNGIELGLSPDSTGFRPTGNLIFQLDDAGAVSGMAGGNFPGLGINAAGWGILETSLVDGFTMTLEADVNGFSFTFSDIEQAGMPAVTTLTYSSTFSGTQFVDNFGTGHFYMTAQKNGAGTNPLTMNINEFSICVVPEPSSAALAGLGMLGFLARRRR